MSIILVIRRSREYYLNDRVTPWLDRQVSVWNFFYKLPYITFRHRLCDIASLTYFPNKFDKIYLWARDDEYKEMNIEGNIVIAVDEDDWISSSLAGHIRDIDFESEVVKWNCANINTSQAIIDWGWLPLNYCASCSYAIKTPHQNVMNIANNVWMGRYQGPVQKIDKLLAVKVDNFASLSWLENETVDSMLTTMQKREIVKMAAPIQEFELQVKLYNELLSELYDSCKIK